MGWIRRAWKGRGGLVVKLLLLAEAYVGLTVLSTLVLVLVRVLPDFGEPDRCVQTFRTGDAWGAFSGLELEHLEAELAAFPGFWVHPVDALDLELASDLGPSDWRSINETLDWAAWDMTQVGGHADGRKELSVVPNPGAVPLDVLEGALELGSAKVAAVSRSGLPPTLVQVSWARGGDDVLPEAVLAAVERAGWEERSGTECNHFRDGRWTPPPPKELLAEQFRRAGRGGGFAAALLLAVFLSGLGTLAMASRLGVYPRTSPGRPWALHVGWGAAGAVVALGGEVVLSWAQEAIGLPVPAEQDWVATLRDLPALQLAGVAVLGVLAVPWVEEMLFRRVLFGSLRDAFGVRTALVASSLVFALAHGNWTAFALYAWAGAVFALLLHRTGSTTAPVVAHVGLNAVALGVALWP